MKKLFKGFLFFAVGFAFMGTSHFLTQCESFDRIINPPGDSLDQKGAEETAASVEEAFLLGDVAMIKSLMRDQPDEYFTSLLDSTSTDRLFTFGEAFKDRELKAVSELYAEYHFEIDGYQYSVTLARESKDKWVLTRF